MTQTPRIEGDAERESTDTVFRFRCTTCGEWHEGMPSLAVDAPSNYYEVPEEERAHRCELTTDTCVVDGKFFFVRGCLEIPVSGSEQPFVWGVWVSLSLDSFQEFAANFVAPHRSHSGPYFGWFPADFLVYPGPALLRTHVHLRDGGPRPRIELEPTDHPLAIEQREGISFARLAEIYTAYLH